jgi:hypothetical protein
MALEHPNRVGTRAWNTVVEGAAVVRGRVLREVPDVGREQVRIGDQRERFDGRAARDDVFVRERATQRRDRSEMAQLSERDRRFHAHGEVGILECLHSPRREWL